MAETIGIKLADGRFYPIMDAGLTAKKRLVLTTVRDYQKSVQIDFYKSQTGTMAGALYVGSLVIENLQPRVKGGPSIELVIDAADDGVISAESFDMANIEGEHQHLSLHLKSFEEDTADYSGFNLDEDAGGEAFAFTNGAALEEISLYSQPEDDEGEGGIPLLLGVIIVLLLLCAGLWFFLFRSSGFPWEARKAPPSAPPPVEAPAEPSPEPAPPSAPPPESGQPPPPEPAPEPPAPRTAQAPPPPAVIDTPPPVQSPPPARKRPAAPVYSFKVPQTIPPEGISYKIRWGDTLWDITEAFYRNPWLYRRIARHNNLNNPNLIVSGTEIIIPPRDP
jgi:nucleoid-associated protein YgaU